MDDLLFWEHLRRVLTFSRFLSEEQCVTSACNRMALPANWGTYFVNEALQWGLIELSLQSGEGTGFIENVERRNELNRAVCESELNFSLNYNNFNYF